MNEIKLTDKQQRFCEEYIIDLNATAAALRAGYARRSANNIGPGNLLKEGIQREIQRLKAERSERLQLEADDVVQELTRVGFSNIDDYLTVDENGEVYIKDFNRIDRNKLAAVESVKVNVTKKNESREYTTIQFKLHSKLNALEQLGKHMGIYEKDNTQKAPPQQITEKELQALLISTQGPNLPENMGIAGANVAFIQMSEKKEIGPRNVQADGASDLG